MKKWLDRAFLAGLCALLAVMLCGTLLWGRKAQTSYYENRSLNSFPILSGQSLLDGSFGSALESWFSDHLPGRTTLLKLDTRVQMNLLHRPVVNDVAVEEGVLLSKPSFTRYSTEAYEAQGTVLANRFARLSEFTAECGGRFYYVGLPEQANYFRDYYPAYSRSDAAETADTVFARLLEERGVRFLDMGAEFDRLGHPAEFYSAVDHHYRYSGAYAAYRAILDALAADGYALPVLTEDDLDFTALPNPYIGSRNRKLYNLWPNDEQAVIGVQKNPVAFTRWDNGQPSQRPLFVLPEAAELPTTYNLYMGGDFGETVLKTDRPQLPNALIFGDSFTNALETLLYASFDETHILDLRHYDGMSLKDCIAQYRPDVVVCVMNDTFYYTATGNGAVWADEP